MKKFLIVFLQLFLTILILNAQNECLTPSPTPPAWIFSNSSKFTQSAVTSDSRLNIFVHIVRSSNGSGLSTSILQPILSSLNSYYQDVIQFSLLGSDFIDDDTYYIDLTLTEANELFNIGNHCNAIDIYILGSSTSFGGAGMAQDIPSKAYIVHGSYYDTSTLPHEMGHCLGLYHTHHGTVNEGGGDLSQCAELVNGSNSTTCGDYISDTPADPDVWSPNSCSYTGTGLDANGQEYNPSTSNLMSYALKSCRANFSAIQIQRIQDFINNTQILQNTLFSTISGPTLLCSSSNSTFTLSNRPAGSTVHWTKGNYLEYVSGQGTDNYTVTPSDDGYGSWISATIYSNCDSIVLPQYSIWAGSPGPGNIQGPDGLPTGCIVNYSINAQGDPTTYQWSMAGRILCPPNELWDYLYGDDTYSATVLAGCQSRYIGVTVGNQCGTTYVGKYVDIDDNYECNGMKMLSDTTINETEINVNGNLVIYPNPASDNVQVSLAQNSALSDAFSSQRGSNSYSVLLFNIYGTLVYSLKNTSCPFTLPLSGLKDGIYIINVSDKHNTYQLQLIVKH